MNLLTVANTKLMKSDKYNFMSIGLHLLPHTLADPNHNLCRYSTPSCRRECLVMSGSGGYPKVYESRKKKTLMYLHDRENFLRQLDAELYYYTAVAKNKGKKLSVRLNLTQEIDWQQEFLDGKTLFEIHNTIQFYDYGKNYNAISFYDNYHLTYSYDSINHDKAMKVLERGDTIAVVYDKIMPKTFYSYETFNMDENDLRFLDPKGKVGMLKYKNVIKKGISNKILIEQSTMVIKHEKLLKENKITI